jgi:hypothetical protein
LYQHSDNYRALFQALRNPLGVLPGASRRFEFDKSRELFIGTYNETPSVAAMCIHNKYRSPVRINR